MKITRSEAITMAVRRHCRVTLTGWGATYPTNDPAPSILRNNPNMAASVRKHFSRVCGQYEVVDDVPTLASLGIVEWNDPLQQPASNSRLGQCYDGHSLRI